MIVPRRYAGCLPLPLVGAAVVFVDRLRGACTDVRRHRFVCPANRHDG